MREGTIKKSDLSQNCGFIIPADNSQQIFIHISQLRQFGLAFPEEGQRIFYEVDENSQKSFLPLLKEMFFV